mmetsp:Transcript_71645/g.108205  ORF Transcript_71645/g.108205 Transcript_71645/m.108205 type:complete len:121 (-) Transcript_71645:124-486(-)
MGGRGSLSSPPGLMLAVAVVVVVAVVVAEDVDLRSALSTLPSSLLASKSGKVGMFILLKAERRGDQGSGRRDKSQIIEASLKSQVNEKERVLLRTFSRKPLFFYCSLKALKACQCQCQKM